MNPTEHLTYNERIARIGQLLAKGITLLLLHEAEVKRRGLQVDAKTWSTAGRNEFPHGKAFMPDIDDDVEQSIYEYLTRVHSAAPRDIMRAFGLSKATVFRKLAHLAAASLVVRSGKTTAIRYRLSSFVSVSSCAVSLP